VRLFRAQKAVRILLEPIETTLVAEVVRGPGVLDMSDRVFRRDAHAADGIDDFRRGAGWRGGHTTYLAY
jgi:hypothetical protein